MEKNGTDGCIEHAILHALFSGQPDHEFSSMLSVAPVHGTAACGIACCASSMVRVDGGQA